MSGPESDSFLLLRSALPARKHPKHRPWIRSAFRRTRQSCRPDMQSRLRAIAPVCSRSSIGGRGAIGSAPTFRNGVHWDLQVEAAVCPACTTTPDPPSARPPPVGDPVTGAEHRGTWLSERSGRVRRRCRRCGVPGAGRIPAELIGQGASRPGGLRAVAGPKFFAAEAKSGATVIRRLQVSDASALGGG